MKFLIYLFLVFLYVFGPVFNSLGSWADAIFVISFLFMVYNTYKNRNIVPAYAKYLYILIPVFIYVSIMVALQPTFNVSEFFTQLLKPLRILVTLFGGYALVQIINKKYKGESAQKTIEFIFYAVVLHSLIMLLQFQNVAFKDFIYKYTSTGEFRSTFEYDFRMGGLSGGTGGAVLSVVQSIGILLIPFLLKKTEGFWKKIWYVFCGLIIFASILVCGRSGLWSVLLFTPVSIYLSDSRLKFITVFKLALSGVAGIYSIILIIHYAGGLNESNPLFYALNRTFDTFISFNDSGKFNDETTTALSNQILIPDNVLTFVFGDADNIINTQFNRKLNSDIGYIRDLWGFGIIATAVFIWPLYQILLSSYKQRRKYYSAAIVFLLTVVMLFFHTKENFLYVRMLFSMYSLVLASFYLSCNEDKILKNTRVNLITNHR